jgi:hypothetical protein
MNLVGRRMQGRDEGPRDVFDVHDGTPWRAVALEANRAGRIRPGNEVIEHEVEPQARRKTIGRRIPKVERAEVVVRELGEVLLHEDFGLPVRSYWIEVSLLRQEIIAPGAVVAARRREDEALDAGFLGKLSHADRRSVVDLVGQLRIQVPERIVGQTSQVQNRVESLYIVDRDVADVLDRLGDRLWIVAIRAAREDVAIQAVHLMPCVQEHWRQNHTDIAFVPR